MATVFTTGDHNFNFQYHPRRFWSVGRFTDPNWRPELGRHPTTLFLGFLTVTYWRTSWHPIVPSHPNPVGLDAKLHDAVGKEDVAEVKRLLEAGADANSTDEHGVPVLMHAVLSRNVELVRAILAAGGDANSMVAESHITSLMWAGHTTADMVRELLEAGADPNAKESHSTSSTPIHWAFNSRRTDSTIVKLLVHYGADVNVPYYSGETPLLLAAKYRLAQLIHPLLSAGADPDIRAWDDTNTWSWARRRGNGTVLRILEDWRTKTE